MYNLLILLITISISEHLFYEIKDQDWDFSEYKPNKRKKKRRYKLRKKKGHKIDKNDKKKQDLAG